jgi:hypothetical protein
MIEAGRRDGQTSPPCQCPINFSVATLRQAKAYQTPYTFPEMKVNELIDEILGIYQKHGWQLRRVLLRPESRAELETGTSSLGGVAREEAELDALWFSRPSHEQREAWELRLVAENPYALFETFEADESEEEREDVRREMEARMREHSTKKVPSTE